VVDTQGLLLGVVVTEANTQDRLGGVAVLMEEACESETLQLLWVDQGYTGQKASACDLRFAAAQRSRIPLGRSG
jgi:transposase